VELKRRFVQGLYLVPSELSRFKLQYKVTILRHIARSRFPAIISIKSRWPWWTLSAAASTRRQYRPQPSLQKRIQILSEAFRGIQRGGNTDYNMQADLPPVKKHSSKICVVISENWNGTHVSFLNYNDQVEEDEIGGACSTNGEEEEHV
jgi:hypothetical protein